MVIRYFYLFLCSFFVFKTTTSLITSSFYYLVNYQRAIAVIKELQITMIPAFYLCQHSCTNIYTEKGTVIFP